jgi:hypothetical protein
MKEIKTKQRGNEDVFKQQYQYQHQHQSLQVTYILILFFFLEAHKYSSISFVEFVIVVSTRHSINSLRMAKLVQLLNFSFEFFIYIFIF